MNKVTFLKIIGLSNDYIKNLSTNKDKCYKIFYKKKRSGGQRMIFAPNKELKGVQRVILDNIISEFPTHSCATAYKKGASIKNNAELHLDNKYIISVDICDFFSSIKFGRIFEYLKNYEEDEVAEYISKICTYNGFLPQGAVTSPAISNVVFSKLMSK